MSALLVILEAPAHRETNAEKNALPQRDSVEDNGTKYLMKRALEWVKGFAVCNLINFIASELLWRGGFIEKTFPSTGGTLAAFITSVSFVAKPPKSNGVPGQDLAQPLHSHGHFLTGLSLFIPYPMIFQAMTLVTSFFTEFSLPIYMGSKLLIGLLLTNLHTAWVHTITSKPTNESLWQRMLNGRQWLAIMPIASLDILLPDTVYHLTKATVVFFQANDVLGSTNTPGDFAVIVTPVLLSWFTALLTHAIYTKVAMSLADGQDDQEPKACLSILDAINSITAQNWHRYLAMMWEVALYEYIWACFSCIVILAELHYLAPCAIADVLAWLTRD
ncbi:unnamed protein product [Penicillium salamii]|uniref:Uncharacterized protein n=1 Tax=Penicillium salamii TaxID=1612424 RepID=A0A9W4JCV9_9EURO|nr:unnamed protein product [Penicillium salamii]